MSSYNFGCQLELIELIDALIDKCSLVKTLCKNDTGFIKDAVKTSIRKYKTMDLSTIPNEKIEDIEFKDPQNKKSIRFSSDISEAIEEIIYYDKKMRIRFDANKSKFIRMAIIEHLAYYNKLCEKSNESK